MTASPRTYTIAIRRNIWTPGGYRDATTREVRVDEPADPDPSDWRAFGGAIAATVKAAALSIGADDATAAIAGSNAACGDWTSKRMLCGGELTVRW